MAKFNNYYYDIRKLSSKDAGLLSDMQKEAPYTSKETYPGHKGWIIENINKVKKGERIAFGCFVKNIHNNSYEEKMIVSAILKLNTFSSKAELKNFIASSNRLKSIANKEEVSKSLEIFKDSLLDKVMLYCQTKGYRGIETELPSFEKDLIGFFLRENFSIKAKVTSRYKINDEFYIFDRDLNLSYNEDPFDYNNVTSWVIQNYFGFEFVKSNIQLCPNNKEKYFIEYMRFKKCMIQKPCENDDFYSIFMTTYINNFKGFNNCQEEYILNQLNDINFMFDFYDNNTLKTFCDKYKIKYFNKESILCIIE